MIYSPLWYFYSSIIHAIQRLPEVCTKRVWSAILMFDPSYVTCCHFYFKPFSLLWFSRTVSKILSNISILAAVLSICLCACISFFIPFPSQFHIHDLVMYRIPCYTSIFVIIIILVLAWSILILLSFTCKKI